MNSFPFRIRVGITNWSNNAGHDYPFLELLEPTKTNRAFYLMDISPLFSNNHLNPTKTMILIVTLAVAFDTPFTKDKWPFNPLYIIVTGNIIILFLLAFVI